MKTFRYSVQPDKRCIAYCPGYIGIYSPRTFHLFLQFISFQILYMSIPFKRIFKRPIVHVFFMQTYSHQGIYLKFLALREFELCNAIHAT
ncbi:hypothetical protein MSMAT_2177 [Methanosarcina mazei TMA]|nr:hypothetical protein MSMAT_2177 [Methanosarcina mazei TMA]